MAGWATQEHPRAGHCGMLGTVDLLWSVRHHSVVHDSAIAGVRRHMLCKCITRNGAAAAAARAAAPRSLLAGTCLLYVLQRSVCDAVQTEDTCAPYTHRHHPPIPAADHTPMGVH